jgi:uncharacterized hydantoinase/oxoprolinase family protein
LARTICADIEILTKAEITALAREIYEAQLDAITNGIQQVASRLHINRALKRKCSVTVAGLGRKFLAAKAAEKAGFTKILDLENILDHQSAMTAPSVAAAIMLKKSIIA